jgi:putative addiction module component (TIGR02574 family)
MGNAVAAILQLPLADRIEAVKAIWESIGADVTGASLPLPDAQRRELDARLDVFDSDPRGGEPWATVRERVGRTR